MSFVTGNANSISDLLLAIQNACTANGWTLSASGNVLYKGSCYIEVKVVSGTIQVRGGKNIDGSGNLTSPTDQASGSLGVSWGRDPIVYPLTYFIHILTSPDEVYVIINYSATCYQNVGWGQSSMLGLSGSGNWYCGCQGTGDYGGFGTNGEYSYVGYAAGSLFMRWYDSNKTHGVDHELDSVTWQDQAFNGFEAMDLFGQNPNAWNSEAILIPLRAYASRPSGFYSPVLELAHARGIRIDNLTDQQIITIGSDKWKIYPVFKRSSWSYQSSPPAQGTGSWYAGHAIRYDGP